MTPFEPAPSIEVVLTALLGALPGLCAWWWGRRVVARRAEPLLAERYLALRRRLTVVTALAAGGLVPLLWEQLAWILPLVYVSLALGSLPARRALLGETWGPLGFLAFQLRWLLAMAGFWVTLALAPGYLARLEDRAFAVGLGLLLVFAAWSRYFPRVVGWLLGARSLAVERPDLLPVLRDLEARTDLGTVAVMVVPVRGGRLVNAFALPSLRMPSVLFTRPALELLTSPEVVAIHAHELAHLEHFRGRRLWRLVIGEGVLVLAGTLLLPLLLRSGGTAVGWLHVLWPLVLFGWLLLRIKDRQQGEHDADLRALALTGDVETLVAGLTKVHLANLIPRRWDPELEQRASHPSLARRLQAIREAAAPGTGGTVPAPADAGVGEATVAPTTSPLPGAEAASGVLPSAHLVEPVTEAVATGPGSWVVLEPGRVHWLTGLPPETATTAPALLAAAPTAQRYALEQLVELRMAIAGESPQLVARDRHGRRWQVPVAAADVARVQAYLDHADGRLARAAPVVAARYPLGRLFAWLAGILGLLPGVSWVVALLGFAGLLRPRRPVLAAVGAACMGSVPLLLWSETVGAERSSVAVMAGLLALAGGGTLTSILRRQQATAALGKPLPAWVWLLLALAPLALLAVLVGLGASSLVVARRLAVGLPAATLAPLAAGAWLLAEAPPRRRLAAALAACALPALVLASPLALAGSRDPLLDPGPRVVVGPAGSRMIWSRTVPVLVDAAVVAGDGSAVALRLDDEDVGVDWETIGRAVAGEATFDEATESSVGDQARWQVLALEPELPLVTELVARAVLPLPGGDLLAVAGSSREPYRLRRLGRVDGQLVPRWETPAPALTEVEIGARDGRFVLAGMLVAEGERWLVALDGDLGSGALGRLRRWQLPAREGQMVYQAWVAGEGAVGLTWATPFEALGESAWGSVWWGLAMLFSGGADYQPGLGLVALDAEPVTLLRSSVMTRLVAGAPTDPPLLVVGAPVPGLWRVVAEGPPQPLVALDEEAEQVASCSDEVVWLRPDGAVASLAAGSGQVRLGPAVRTTGDFVTAFGCGGGSTVAVVEQDAETSEVRVAPR